MNFFHSSYKNDKNNSNYEQEPDDAIKMKIIEKYHSINFQPYIKTRVYYRFLESFNSYGYPYLFDPKYMNQYVTIEPLKKPFMF